MHCLQETLKSPHGHNQIGDVLPLAMGSGIHLCGSRLQAANLATLPPDHGSGQSSSQHIRELLEPSLPSCPEEGSALASAQQSSPRQPSTPEATDDACLAESRNPFSADSQLTTDQSDTLAQTDVQGITHPLTRLAAASRHSPQSELQQPAEAATQPAGCLQQDGTEQRAMRRDTSHSLPAQAFLRPVLTHMPAEVALHQPSTAWSGERDDALSVAPDVELTSDRDMSGEEHALTHLIAGAAMLLAGVGQWGFDTLVFSQVRLPDQGRPPRPLCHRCGEVAKR